MKEKKWKKHPLFDTCLIANALNPELIGHIANRTYWRH